jgi:hypothetical protein
VHAYVPMCAYVPTCLRVSHFKAWELRQLLELELYKNVVFFNTFEEFIVKLQGAS